MTKSEDTPASIGPHRLFTQYLTRRKPAPMLTDACILFIIHLLVRHTWASVYKSSDYTIRTQPVGSFREAFTSPTGLLSILSTFFLGLTIGLAAWALVRHLSHANTPPGDNRHNANTHSNES